MSSLWLTGTFVALGPRTTIRADVEVFGGRIRRLVRAGHPPAQRGGTIVNLDGYLILPGLINAHDHLEFNLFPRLGWGPYRNSREWAHDIYKPNDAPVREHLAVPREVRLWWGGLKNLLSGVTTVCHHNPYETVFDLGFPVRVVRRYGWAHSLAFERDVAGAFRSTAPEAPFVIHAAEGTDRDAADEIFALDRMGALDSRTILVHGVGLTREGHALLAQRGAAVVWCPTSNRFTLGTTLDVSLLAAGRAALGTDSALTGRGTLLDEIHAAHQEEGADADTVYTMVTKGAADVFRLRDGEGRAHAASLADLLAIPWTGAPPAQAIVSLDPSQIEMVLLGGKLQLASESIASRWPLEDQAGLEEISLADVRRKVRAPGSWLIAETAKYLPDGFSLAGKRISA